MKHCLPLLIFEIGITKAKEAGVLHRDLSIGNILFERSESGVEGVLIDWDHAQLVQQQISSQASFRSVSLVSPRSKS